MMKLLVASLLLFGCSGEFPIDEIVALEKACKDKLKNEEPSRIEEMEFSLGRFCYCYVKEDRPKDECEKEATTQ